MGLDTLLEAARYIEQREFCRHDDCLCLEEQIGHRLSRHMQTKAELKYYESDTICSSVESSMQTPIHSDISSDLSADSGWTTEGFSMDFEADADRLLPRLRALNRTCRSSRVSKRLATSGDDQVTSCGLSDGEVKSDEQSMGEVIGSLQGQVHRISRMLVEVQSRVSGVRLQMIENARANFTESYRRHLEEPERFAAPPLANITNFTPDRTSTPFPTRQQSGRGARKRAVGDDASVEVPIGSGKTSIPRHVYNQIDWSSYTIATRKLLMAVFTRRTLATHCLTGKASPAFQGKPAKLRLDTRKVNDIVMTVVERCGVRAGLVRSCITNKCADENKMYKMRHHQLRNE